MTQSSTFFVPIFKTNILNMSNKSCFPAIFDGSFNVRHQNLFRRNFFLGAIAVYATFAATLVLSTGISSGSAAIRVAQNPSAKATTAFTFSATPTSGAAPLVVNFRASNAIATTIDFGDGATGTMIPAPTCARCPSLAIVGHIYSNSGTYTAKLVSADTTLGSQLITVVPPQ
jgi:PKD repeat protein